MHKLNYNFVHWKRVRTTAGNLERIKMAFYLLDKCICKCLSSSPLLGTKCAPWECSKQRGEQMHTRTHNSIIWAFSKYFHLQCRQRKMRNKWLKMFSELSDPMHRNVCAFLWLFRAGSSFRVTEQMYLFYLFITFINRMCALLNAFTGNLDDVQFGFL